MDRERHILAVERRTGAGEVRVWQAECDLRPGLAAVREWRCCCGAGAGCSTPLLGTDTGRV